MDGLLLELRLGLRRLRRDALLTATAVLSLAIGIGANTALYTVARALLFQPQAGISAPGELVDIGVTDQGHGFNPLSYPDYVNLRTRAATLQAVYAYNLFPQAMSLTRSDGTPDRIYVTLVSANYFTGLGVLPAAGRMLGPPDGEGLTASPVIVISDALWQRLYNRDPAAVGRALTVNGHPATIVGVAPAGFHGTGIRSAEAWLPIGALQSADAATLLTTSHGSWLLVGGRRRPGVSVARANAEVEIIGQSLPSRTIAATHGLHAAAASPVPGAAAPISAFMSALLAILCLVLTVACANVSGMLLSRVPMRNREMAVRSAIGATRGRLVRQLLLETTLLFLISAAAGLVVARLLTAGVLTLLPALPFPVDLQPALDARAVFFATMLAMGAAILSGLVPAAQASRIDLTTALNADRHGPARLRLRRAFVAIQVALSIVLVIVGGLFVRAILYAGAANPGFDARNIDLISIGFASEQAATAEPALTALIERLQSISGVEQVTAGWSFPGGFEELRLGSLRLPGSNRDVTGEWNSVAPGFFDTIRMPLLAGRDFSPADRAGGVRVAVLGAGAVRQLWPGRRVTAAVGEVIEQRGFNPVTRSQDTTPLTIVGVSRDPAYGTLVDGSTDVHIYVPFAQQPLGHMLLIVRTAEGRSAASEARAAITATTPGVTIEGTRSGEEYSMLGLMPQRVGALVTASLGVIGLLLAAIGVYGVTAYTVMRRTREIGIRMALGAPLSAITRLIVGEGMSMIGIGCAFGLPLGFGAAQLVSGYLAGLPPTDPPTFWGTAVLFATMGLVACSGPLVRALRISVTEVLHEA